MHTPSEVFGIPDSWEFDYPFEDFLETGFWLWAMSGFKHLPNQDEIAAYDKRYISDMKLIKMIYDHQGNNNEFQKMVDDMVMREKIEEGRAILEKENKKLMNNADQPPVDLTDVSDNSSLPAKKKKPRWNVMYQPPSSDI